MQSLNDFNTHGNSRIWHKQKLCAKREIRQYIHKHRIDLHISVVMSDHTVQQINNKWAWDPIAPRKFEDSIDGPFWEQ